jgi:hypothetical protein
VYSLSGQPLEVVEAAKYLGVTIDNKLSWKTHITTITARANCVLGILKRNLYNAPTPIKEKAYFSLVRPHLEYCSTTWEPHQQYLCRKIEMVQRRAARFALNRYHNTSSVTDMLQQLNWPTLAQRRLSTRVCFIYKITHNLVAVPTYPYLTPLPYTSRHCNSLSYTRYTPRTDLFKYSFFPKTIVQWNALPDQIVVLPTIVSFKAAVATHYESTQPPPY